MLRSSGRILTSSAFAWSRVLPKPTQNTSILRRLSSDVTETASKVKEGFNFAQLFLYIPSAVCGCLCYWQWERRRWKMDLIKIKEQDLENSPTDIFEAEELFDHQKVKVEGILHHESTLFVGPRARSIPGKGTLSGYAMITPVYDPNRRGVVLVNRGWVPMAWQKDPAVIAPRNRPERVSVIGVIQPNENPNTMLFKNDPEKEQFQFIDRAAMCQCLGLPEDTPLVMAITDDPSATMTKPQNALDAARRPLMPLGPVTYPLPKHVNDLAMFTTMPQDHMNYAITWGSLFIILAFMARKATTEKASRFKMIGGYNVNEYKTSS